MTELERRRRELPPHLVFLAILALWSAWAVSCFFLNEDAFISFRYVQNLVSGQGLVYNPGVHDEGYSNLLWILLLAPFALAGIPPERAAPALGILSGAVLLYVVWRMAKRLLPDRRWLPLAAPGFVAASFSVVYWAGSGLETVFFGLLLVCAVFFHLREPSEPSERLAVASYAPGKKPGRFPWTGLFLGLAALTRPEGFGFILIFAVHYLYCRWRKIPIGSDWRALIPALGLVAAQLVFHAIRLQKDIIDEALVAEFLGRRRDAAPMRDQLLDRYSPQQNAIMRALAEFPEGALITDILSGLGVDNYGSINTQLNRLRNMGVVQVEKTGRRNRYVLSRELARAFKKG